MTTNNNKPAATLRDGNLKAVIWKNEKEDRVFYSTTFSRTYKTGEGNYADTNGFSGSELLRIAQLATKAYEHAHGLRKQAVA
jgi:hypothetical protein